MIPLRRGPKYVKQPPVGYIRMEKKNSRVINPFLIEDLVSFSKELFRDKFYGKIRNDESTKEWKEMKFSIFVESKEK